MIFLHIYQAPSFQYKGCENFVIVMKVYRHNLDVLVPRFGSVLKQNPEKQTKDTKQLKRPKFINAMEEGPAHFSLPTESLH